MRIAVIDDDYTARTLISEFLEDEGHEVTASDNPDTLMNLKNFDAIIMDVMIYNARDAGIKYILKNREEGKIVDNTLIVFISNFGRREVENLLQQIDNCVWLDKPIDFIELLKNIRKQSH